MISHHRRFRVYARSQAMGKQLVRRGHAVTLVVTADRRRAGTVESEMDGVRVIETPDLLWGSMRSGWDPWGLLHRMIGLGREKSAYDLVHCFETRPTTIYPALRYLRRHPAPLLTDWNDWWGRGGIIDEFRPRWYRALFGGIETYYEEAFRARADGLTVISTALRDRAIRMGIPRERICRIPGGTVPDRFPPRSVEECRKKMGLPPDGVMLGYSSIDSHAELDTMMKVLSIVARRHPTAKLLVTGKTDPKILERARAHHVSGNLYLTGFVPFEELGWYLGCVDIFFLPFPPKIYNIGRWPNKIGEYMCVGRPIVSNPVGDMKPLFEEHEIGLLAEWSADDIAGKVLRLIDNPPEAERFGRNARRLAETEFDWGILVKRLEDFYGKVLDRGPGSGPRGGSS